MSREDREGHSSLQFLAPIVILGGIVTYMLISIVGTPQSSNFLQFASILGLVVYLLTFANIHAGIAITILCIGISPELTVFGFSNIRLEDFLLPILMFAWLTRHLDSHEEFVSAPLKGPILWYLGISILAALMGTAMGTLETRKWVLVLGKMFMYFILYLIILNNVKTFAEFKAYVILMVLVSVISIAFGFQGNPVRDREGAVSKLMGPYGETANIYAGYLAMNLGLMIGLFLYLNHFRHRFLLGIGIAGASYASLITMSRTGYISVVTSLAIVGLFKIRKLLVVTAIALVIFPLIAPEQVISRARTIMDIPSAKKPESLAARISEWEYSLQLVMGERPLMGFGLGSVSLGDVDNEYVRVLRDTGFLGLFIFCILIWKCVRLSWNLIGHETDNPLIRGFSAGYALALLGTLVHMLGATTLTSIRSAETFWILTALASVLYVRLPEWTKEREPSSEEIPVPYTSPVRS